MTDAQGQLRQAAHEIQRYLSDEIAPMMAVDAYEVLAAQRPEATAQVIAQWATGQQRAPLNAVRVSDLIYHCLKKLHLLAEFELVGKEGMARVLWEAARILIAHVPVGEREGLKVRVSRLGDDAASVMMATPGRLYGGGMETPVPETGPAPTPNEPSDVTFDRGMRTLSVLLQRLQQFAPEIASLASKEPVAAVPTAQSPAGPVPASTLPSYLASALAAESAEGAPARPAGPPVSGRAGEVLARTFTNLALHAKSADQLDASLEQVRQHGVDAPMDQVFRTLGWSLPGWQVEGKTEDGQDAQKAAAGRQLAAMEKIVGLGRDSNERAKRWGEMVYAAIEQFNEGRLAQAACILDGARRLIEEKRPDPSIVGQVLSQAQAALSEKVLKRLSESMEKRDLLKRILTFFPGTQPEGLLSNLEGEPRRDLRKLRLALLECHGLPARQLALERLRAYAENEIPDEHGFQRRNLAYLLRRIPPPDQSGRDEEIQLLAGLITRGQPPMSAKEAIGALGQLGTPRAEAALIARLRDLEKEAALPSMRDTCWDLLDRTCAALARQGSREAIREVCRHAFLRDASLGDTLARAAHLGRIDLSIDEEQVAVLVRAIRERMPKKMLGFKVGRAPADLEGLVAVVCSTPLEEVRAVLRDVARAWQGDPMGDRAAAAVAKLEPKPVAGPQAEALSGDLELFALPNLLQSLAQSQSTGDLVLFDRKKERRATVWFAQGSMVRCESGKLTGAEAVYRVLESPFPGTFVFKAGTAPTEHQEPLDVLEVMLEGLRRYDEYQEARTLAPDGIALEGASAPKATPTPEDEKDLAFVRAVWKRAAAGTPPEVCEADAATDPFRVRRLYAWWLEQGLLRPRTAPSMA
ncbi:MAG TPA: DUF4388 domain-containing protein [Candidatus Polarisedimenticolaceae bacterium]|nr:DUF4388 domain-containing protein [Candidatus Polarisedimenticolaceae bacterium]